MTWDGERAVGADLYYDPVVDEHVGRGPIGLIAPAWYFAPQQPEVAAAGWQLAAGFNGVFGDGPITGLDNPASAVMLLQLAGEFADPETKARLWQAADAHVEPTWDRVLGEFTLGFGLDEAHPRGQWNARAMAGWICSKGAWSRIFNRPNLDKFAEPTIHGVDFPRVALSEARWDGERLWVAAHPQNASVERTQTEVAIAALPDGDWSLARPDGTTTPIRLGPRGAIVTLTVDNRVNVVRRD